MLNENKRFKTLLEPMTKAEYNISIGIQNTGAEDEKIEGIKVKDKYSDYSRFISNEEFNAMTYIEKLKIL